MSNGADNYVRLYSEDETGVPVAIRQTNDERRPTGTRVHQFTARGPRINEDTIVTIPAAFACMRYLSTTVALLDWELKRRQPVGYEVLTRSPLHRIINRRASADFSSYQFRETMVFWALRYGNGYAEIERDTLGRPIALHPIHPTRVEVCRDVDTQELFYEVTNHLKTRVDLNARDVFHLRGFGEGVVGLNVAAYAADSLGWVKAAQLFGAGFFNNGANPSGVVTVKKMLSPDGLLGIRDEFRQLYGGPRNNAGIAVLDNGMEYAPIGIDPEKGQFIETNQHLIVEVCRWFGVPPHKIHHLLHATFSNIEHQSIEVVQDSVRPWCKRLSDEADYKLVARPSGDVVTMFDFRSLLQGDSTARAAWYKTLREMGVYSANDIRSDEGLNTIGPDGDKRVLQSQYTTLEKIGEEPIEPEPVDEPADEPVDEPADEPAETEQDDEQTTAARERVQRWALSRNSARQLAIAGE